MFNSNFLQQNLQTPFVIRLNHSMLLLLPVLFQFVYLTNSYLY